MSGLIYACPAAALHLGCENPLSGQRQAAPMKQSLQLRLGQHLTMTPQLQQAIRLLQLSTLELQTEVQEVLESNLMLEVQEYDKEDSGGGAGEDFGANGEHAETPADASGDQDRELNLEPANIPEDLAVDSAWDDVYDGGAGQGSGVGNDGMDLERTPEHEGGLREHLDWQLLLTPFSEVDRAIATAIVDAIDDDGYLSGSLEDIQASIGGDLEVGLDEVEAVLHRVQAFDPPGVAARDLRECLLIQLRQLPPDTPSRDLALRLVSDHLAMLGSRDQTQLLRRMKISSDELQRIVGLIQALNPRPGNAVSPSEPEFVVPDVYVSKRRGAWHVELNPDAVPRLRINPYYASLIRRADSSADNTTLKAHLQEARWFLKSLQSRSETLLKVATCIVERQKAFLEHGPEAMRPMVLHDVAEAVGMHESTISRVTTRKYMHTSRGIFELKYFFSSHLATQDGGECSSTAIRAVIKKLISAENPTQPLSDSKLATILCQEGVKVARRTVAKYREAMAIPSSNERKRLN